MMSAAKREEKAVWELFRVILVDDEPWVLSGLEEMLHWEDYGFQILGGFTDALQAREAIRAQRPDVVITDIRMPRLSGLELLDALRREGIPSEFVIISAHRDFEAAHTAINQGVFHYLLKPFDIAEVETLLCELYAKLLQSQAVFDPADPEGAENPQIQKVLGAAKRYAHCVLCLSDHQEGVAAPDGAVFSPLLVRSSYDALLISSQTSDGALPTLPARDADVFGGRGYSCVASDFSDLPALYSEAEQALECGFRYSDNRTIAMVQWHLCSTLLARPPRNTK